jgi:hypothetical protein
LTSLAIAAIKVDVMETRSMTSRLHSQIVAVHLTTGIARMLGKAVKLRHCPATVSAPATIAVVWDNGGGRKSVRVPFGLFGTQGNH